MGQEQSAPAPRRAPNKLSKPRTNTTGNLISKIPVNQSRQNLPSSSSSPVKNRHSLLSTDGIPDEAEKPEEKQRKRTSLFRSKSSQAKEKKLDLDSSVEKESVEPISTNRPLPIRRHSRASSVNTVEDHSSEFYSERPPNVSRMSLQHFPYQQHHTRLSLVREVHSPQPEQREEPDPLSRYEQAEIQKPLPRTNSDTTLYGPVRRRSLLQHGVATRKSLFPVNDSRQSLPSQMHANEIKDYYYNSAKSTSSPLSNIAALGREWNNGSPAPRVETPTDMGYDYTGMFKLGSLRIMNGSASPAPSDGRPSTSGAAEEDYLTVGARRSTEANHYQRPSQRSNTLPAPIEVMRPPWVARAESPLRQVHEAEPTSLQADTMFPPQLPLPDPSLALFDFSSKDSPTKSLELAKEYMQELALSPFSFEISPPASPTLQATSKHTAVEDDLFEEEPISPRPPNEHAAGSFDSGYGPGETAKIIPGPQQPAPRPLAKADSGYSSNMSIRSFKKDTAPAVPEKEAPPTPPKEIVSRVASSNYSQEVPSRVASSTYSVSSQASDTTLRAQRSLPVLPHEDVPSKPTRQAPPIPAKHPAHPQEEALRTKETSTKPEPEGLTRPTAKKHGRRQSLPAIPKAAREPQLMGVKNSSSGEPVSSNGSKWRPNKSPKQRPNSVQPTALYTVQAIRYSSVLSVPPVPAETSRKLEERVDGFPIACIPNTVARANAPRRSVSKETLGTIFSVGSAEVRDELNFARLQGALPPVPVQASIPEYQPTPPEQKPGFNRRASHQPPSSRPMLNRQSFEGRRSMQAISRERSPAPIIHAEHQQEDFETHVTSLEIISSSVGKSPYDVAVASVGRPQSSGASARARSMTSQLEADAAARFQRSRDVSKESSILGSRKSYESIAAGNPFASGTNTASHSRKNSREYPPPAHSNASVKRPFSSVPAPPQPVPLLSSEIKKTKSPPPISMQTQRKSLPPMRTAPMVAPERPAPQFPGYGPASFKPHSWSIPPHLQPVPTISDPFEQASNYWAERRKSAGETLQTRRSIEFSRSRPGSARPSMEHTRPAQNLRAYGSFDQSMRNQWEADHAGGSYSFSYSQPATQPQHSESEYYDQEDQGLDFADFNNVGAHGRSGSTDEMLVLDRYTGGLGYGLEGRGLVGSAGTRNSGSFLGGGGVGRKGEKVAREFGVDLSDVPVFLQRVKIES